jgi:hypothetical protein
MNIMPALTTRKLTLKQRRWLDKYYECGNATEAAMFAYDCKDRESASAIGVQNLGKLSFNDIMDGVGLTDHKLISKIQQKMEAKKAIVISNKVAMVDDNQAQLKAVEIGAKFRGRLNDSNTTNIQVNNIIPLLGGDTSKNAIHQDTSNE